MGGREDLQAAQDLIRFREEFGEGIVVKNEGRGPAAGGHLRTELRGNQHGRAVFCVEFDTDMAVSDVHATSCC